MTARKEIEPDEDGVRRDTLGRRIHDSRRGPTPGTGRGGRVHTGMLQARVSPDLLALVDEEAAGRPRRPAANGGRSGVVIDALRLYFYGDARRWQKRYLDEVARRRHAEQRLERVREALG